MQNYHRLAASMLTLALGMPSLADEVSSTFTVLQSQGLALEAGDPVEVRIEVNPAAEGVEGRGAAGSPEIRYAAAVTAVSIRAGSEQFDFDQPLDVVVAPLRNQWSAAWLDMSSGTAPPTESEAAILQAITLSFHYPPDALPLDRPVPPTGALTAEQSSMPRFGLDLMVRGHHGDRREGWSIMGRFQSMGAQP